MKQETLIYGNILNLHCVDLNEVENHSSYWLATSEPDIFAKNTWYSCFSIGGISFYSLITINYGSLTTLLKWCVGKTVP